MNTEALTEDLAAVLEKHETTGAIKATLGGLIVLAASPAGRSLIERYIAGATLFAVDDTSSTVLCHRSPMSHNAGLLTALLVSVTPHQLRGVLTGVVEEINEVKAQLATPKPCNCSMCSPPIFVDNGSKS
jgi:hypothetical protein